MVKGELEKIRDQNCDKISHGLMLTAKEYGFSDKYLAELMETTESQVRQRQRSLGIRRVYRLVDTCAAEFEAKTPYLYSTFETECEAHPTKKKKVVILGGGPNRIGQGIERRDVRFGVRF